MYFGIDREKIFKKYKTIWIKTEDSKNIDLDILSVYDNIYIKTKLRTYGDKVYTNFHGLNVPEDGVEYKSFTITYIDSLLFSDSKY